MIIDSLLELSDAQALTASADATNVVDLGSARQVGAGRPLFVHFSVDVAADFTTTDETYQFNIATGSAATLGTVLNERAILAATLVAGYQFQMAIPVEALDRYIGVEYVLAGTTPTITVSAWITDQEMPVHTPQPDAI
jgi:hypothetical protein